MAYWYVGYFTLSPQHLRALVRSGWACLGPGPRGITILSGTRFQIVGFNESGHLRIALREWISDG